MEIRPTPAGFLAVSSSGEETILWPLAHLREQVIIRLQHGNLTCIPGDSDEMEAAAMLARCELRYEALETDVVGVVLIAPADLVETLRDYDRLPTQMLMTTIYETCSALGGDRVEGESGG
jgi:hypothetical protein